MAAEYVTIQDDVYRIANTCVSLDSVVYGYRRGASPESIQRYFPALTLEQVHGALAFYPAHQTQVNKYLLEEEEEFEKLRQRTRDTYLDWHDKLRRIREKALVCSE